MRTLLLFCCWLWVLSAASQSIDTLYLQEVAVYGLRLSKYTTGSKVKTIALNEQVKTLADGLGSEASLYLKNYGNQQLSTIALRGTTASQTAVLWNGININSPTLGQTDFSLIPLFLFDEVTVQLGTSSSLYGSDAIGGSVILGHIIPEFKKQFHGIFNQQVGSFGKFNAGIKATYGNERWQFRSKICRSFIENDFPYESPAVGFKRKRQVNASVVNYGFDQQAYFRISDSALLDAEIMFTHNDRENQPAVTNDEGSDQLRNKNIRSAINYTRDSKLGVLHVTAAYQFSDQDYDNGEVTTVTSEQLTGQVSIDMLVNHRTDIRYGISYNHYLTNGENFNNKAEGRWDAFASIRYVVTDPWIVNINLRQSVYDQRHAPFSPSVGTEVTLLKNPLHQIIARAQSSRGFRVPTLDDRYWVPGGNPDTKAEDALHAEWGVVYTTKLKQYNLAVDATYHWSDIDYMINWMPDDQGIWRPVNLQKVKINGVELSANLERSLHGMRLLGHVDYSFTESLNQEGASSQNPQWNNKQLAYVPVHNARGALQLTTKKFWIARFQYQYTSIRFTSLENLDTGSQSLSPYHLTDVTLGRSVRFTKWSFDATADINNIFSKYYETLKNRAMPGRNYTLSLLIKI